MEPPHQSLPEPDVDLSAHPAPIDQPRVLLQIANARKDMGFSELYALTNKTILSKPRSKSISQKIKFLLRILAPSLAILTAHNLSLVRETRIPFQLKDKGGVCPDQKHMLSLYHGPAKLLVFGPQYDPQPGQHLLLALQKQWGRL